MHLFSNSRKSNIHLLILGLLAAIIFLGGNRMASDQEVVMNAIIPSAKQIELGRYFFYDKRLSQNGMKSCASCHDRNYAFSDGYRTSIGANGEPLRRNALPLFNADSFRVFTWADNRITDLQKQMEIPLFNLHPVEMGFLSDDRELEIFLSKDHFYRKDLLVAFPDKKAPFSKQEIISCISAFILQLQSYQSDYDLFLQGKKMLTSQQLKGKDLFFSYRLGCSNCHGGINFTNATKSPDAYFNTGIIYLNQQTTSVDSGLFEITRKRDDIGKFRVPSLRNLSFTQPYMHDGSIRTLKAVIEHYQHIESTSIQKPVSSQLRKFSLNDEEEKSLIAFLFTLSDSNFVNNNQFSNPFSQ